MSGSSSMWTSSAAQLRGATIPLGAVTAFGGGFLFCHVDRDSEARARVGKEPRQHPHAMQVERVVVARLGTLGKVESVLSL